MNEIAVVQNEMASAYKIGSVVGSLFWIGIILLFVVSIVRFRKTRGGAWLGTMAGTGLLLLIVGGNLFFGIIHVVMVGTERREAQAKLVSGRMVKSLSRKGSITLPEGWKTQDGLNEIATIQVRNMGKDEYLIVMEMPKDEFAGDPALFEEAATGALEEKLEGERMSETKKSRLGSRETIQREVVDRGVWYLQTVVEGDERHFRFLAWADIRRHKEQSRSTFEQILATFQE